MPAFLLITPVQVMIVVLIFVPVLYVAWLSLNQSSFGQKPVFVGLANYIKVLGDPYFWRSCAIRSSSCWSSCMSNCCSGWVSRLLFASGVPARPLCWPLCLRPMR